MGDKILPDIQIMNPSSLKNLMAHAQIIDNDLVITIDFDSLRFAVSQYLQLAGQKFASAEFKKLLDINN